MICTTRLHLLHIGAAILDSIIRPWLCFSDPLQLRGGGQLESLPYLPTLTCLIHGDMVAQSKGMKVEICGRRDTNTFYGQTLASLALG